jgi:hypothetical protein
MQNENLDKTLNLENHVNCHNACMKICVKLNSGHIGSKEWQHVLIEKFMVSKGREAFIEERKLSSIKEIKVPKKNMCLMTTCILQMGKFFWTIVPLGKLH